MNAFINVRSKKPKRDIWTGMYTRNHKFANFGVLDMGEDAWLTKRMYLQYSGGPITNKALDSL